MSFDIRNVRLLFGGPFAGKTWLAKAIEKANPGLIFEFDSELKKQFPSVPNSAWRPMHPDHLRFRRASDAIKRQMRAHMSQGGVAMRHDPMKEVPTAHTLLIYPGFDVINARKKEWLLSNAADAAGLASRISASDHWYAKATERGWLSQFTKMDSGRALRELLKLPQHEARRKVDNED